MVKSQEEEEEKEEEESNIGSQGCAPPQAAGSQKWAVNAELRILDLVNN